MPTAARARIAARATGQHGTNSFIEVNRPVPSAQKPYNPRRFGSNPNDRSEIAAYALNCAVPVLKMTALSRPRPVINGNTQYELAVAALTTATANQGLPLRRY